MSRFQSEASALASGGLQAAAQHQRFDAAQVLSDNLGQAIGEGVVQGRASVEPPSAAEAIDALYLPTEKADTRSDKAAYLNYLAQQLAGEGGYGELLQASAPLLEPAPSLEPAPIETPTGSP
ncbi:hypothetical protein, partial [Legionella fairfieldensis]